MFLARRYRATGRDDLAAALGPALARTLDADWSGRTPSENAARLILFVETSALSEDERLARAAADLAAHLRNQWPHLTDLEPLMQSVEACLRASTIIDPREIVQPAIDEL